MQRLTKRACVTTSMTNIGHFRAAGKLLNNFQGQLPTRLWIAPPTKMDAALVSPAQAALGLEGIGLLRRMANLWTDSRVVVHFGVGAHRARAGVIAHAQTDTEGCVVGTS